MKEYIPREDALNFETKITAAPSEIQAISQGMSLYAEHIKAIPAADVEEVVHGHFGKRTSPFNAPCSVCGALMNTYWKYCPMCGAVMDGGETDA